MCMGKVKVFYYNLEISADGSYLISQINGVDMTLDEETLLEIFGVPTMGIRSIKSEKGSIEFLKLYNVKDFNNRTLRGEFMLFLELVKGALLPRTYKEINLTGTDQFLIEIFKYKRINLLAIVMEHMNSIINANTRIRGLPYGF